MEKGSKLSNTTKEKMRKSRLQRKEKLGYINSFETRKKISEAKKGSHLSKKTKRKMSLSHK